jgi:hypothetical protein
MGDRGTFWEKVSAPFHLPAITPCRRWAAVGGLSLSVGPSPPGGPTPRGLGGPKRAPAPPALTDAQRRALADPLAEPAPEAAPQPEDTVVPDGVRREELGRTSLPATGTRYPSLKSSATLLVRTGAMMFWTCLVLAVVVAAAVLVYLQTLGWSLGVRATIGLIAAVALGAPVALLGRILQLTMAVVGELLIVTMDMEDSVRRIADTGARR